ncbi:hypothetical protein J2Z21_002208 [Streptomyces griseochromogenes]|uniref:Uncharacterized protein n=1 Tax=Streptomyces griseochromogenes TaxID=68214 RepID=A0ABS4LPT8_9ACTN|nr:hypothetical protein [Streptomyces griseochromogenes]MBP2049277.1 hypothetical protein [Streptomyces griseochromogenes]
MNEWAQVSQSSGKPGGGKFRRDADHMEKWSMVWVLVAICMWVWFLFLLLFEYKAGGGIKCKAPLFRDAEGYGACNSGMRQWPALLGVLALAVIPTVLAATTTLYSRLLYRMAGLENQNADSSPGSSL